VNAAMKRLPVYKHKKQDISPSTTEVQKIRYIDVFEISTRNVTEPEGPKKQFTI
jgi:hypothetical protein